MSDRIDYSASTSITLDELCSSWDTTEVSIGKWVSENQRSLTYKDNFWEIVSITFESNILNAIDVFQWKSIGLLKIWENKNGLFEAELNWVTGIISINLESIIKSKNQKTIFEGDTIEISLSWKSWESFYAINTAWIAQRFTHKNISWLFISVWDIDDNLKEKEVNKIMLRVGLSDHKNARTGTMIIENINWEKIEVTWIIEGRILEIIWNWCKYEGDKFM